MKMFLALFVALLGVNMAFAQDQDRWDDLTANLLDVTRVEFCDGENVKNLAQDDLANLQKAAQKVKVLGNPECRCLPELKGTLVVFMKNSRILVVQVAEKHWFNAVYFEENRIVNFLLKDAEDGIFQWVEKTAK